MINHKPKSKIVLEELSGRDSSPMPIVQGEVSQETAQHVAITDTTIPHCSGKVRHEPERFIGVGTSSDFTKDLNELDPRNFKEDIQDKDSTSWHSTMKSEIGFMDYNQVYKYENLPDGVKAIWCKWIFKRKRGLDEKVQTFKAR